MYIDIGSIQKIGMDIGSIQTADEPESLSASGDLFIHGYNNIFASGDLFIEGFVDMSGWAPPLFIYGYDAIQTSGDLFTQGYQPIQISGDLFILGPQQITTSNDLYTEGHIAVETSGDLFVYGHVSLRTSGDLFIHGHVDSVSFGDLFIHGHLNYANSGNLFIDGHIDTSGIPAPSLFIHGHIIDSGSIGLFIFGIEPLAKPIDWLLKSSDHYPQIIGTLEGATSVTIQLWEVTDGQNTLVSLVSSDCYQIGNTGRWAWSTTNLPTYTTYQRQYFYIMTANHNNTFAGQFFLEVPERAKWIHPGNRSDYIL